MHARDMLHVSCPNRSEKPRIGRQASQVLPTSGHMRRILLWPPAVVDYPLHFAKVDIDESRSGWEKYRITLPDEVRARWTKDLGKILSVRCCIYEVVPSHGINFSQ